MIYLFVEKQPIAQSDEHFTFNIFYGPDKDSITAWRYHKIKYNKKYEPNIYVTKITEVDKSEEEFANEMIPALEERGYTVNPSSKLSWGGDINFIFFSK